MIFDCGQSGRMVTSVMTKPRIAFLGLGIMGGGMARRLQAAGYPIAVCNRNRSKAASLANDGARVAESPRDAATGAEIVFSMVADDAASRSMWLGQQGALAGAARGAMMVECSTLTVAWVNELAQAVPDAGGEFVDAPVAGSRQAAADGELTFIAGGSDAAIEKVRPALMVMGRRIAHVGGTGSGALVKLVNNFMAGVQVVAMAEGLAWLEQSAIDRDRALAFLLEGAAASPVAKVVAARMRAEDYTPNFLLRLMAKDLGYAMNEAAKIDVTLQTAATALDRFREAIAAGHGDEDMAAVVKAARAPKRS
jgi:3-hydroxyisobutyrate dehydrogenase